MTGEGGRQKRIHRGIDKRCETEIHGTRAEDRKRRKVEHQRHKEPVDHREMREHGDRLHGRGRKERAVSETGKHKI